MTSPVSGASTAAPTQAATSVDRPDQMGKDVFLKLLVAQMKYQDPSNPASSSEMMAQTATFAQVEKLDLLATQNGALLVLRSTVPPAPWSAEPSPTPTPPAPR
jgi:flagellar basal-body rod modification protein FlgD